MIRKLISRVFSGKKPKANRHEPAVIPVSNHGITRDRISSGSRRVCETLQSHGLTAAALQRYAAARQCDRQGGALFTDAVVRTFSTDFVPIKWARGLGLYALDLFPPARHFVAKRMIWGGRGW